jgi:two-component system CheB/CheR fusion protein
MESALSEGDFRIVGVGASASEIDALSSLLDNVSAESLALVVVQRHASHGRDSLANDLARKSALEVVPISDATKVLPNRVYVAPSGCDVGLARGTLHVMQPALPPTRQPIDFFFRSLAEHQGKRAVGVVLSGTGTDGSFGLKAIKEVGGVTLAQRAANDASYADLALPPDGIARELTRLANHQYFSRKHDEVRCATEAIDAVLALFRARLGDDLSLYKPTTLERRIERRLALSHLERIEDYVDSLRTDEAELQRLYKDMLVGTTAFFRDGEPFSALTRTAFPRILEHKAPGSKLRVWVPGCSTGKEAYSVAIALLEFLGNRAQEIDIQIFGTDVDDDAIARARRGIYPENIQLDVNEERLRRFFVKRRDTYEIARRVRDLLVFSKQNVVRDPPFSRVDLVCCRNVLIYLEPAAQKRVLASFNYALEPHGFLMLGTSETVGESTSLFSLVDGKNKLYANKRRDTRLLDVAPERWSAAPSIATKTDANVAARAERAILELCAPSGVVVNDRLEVLHFHGRTAQYLQPVTGFASLDLLRLARAELHADLRNIIGAAIDMAAPSSVTTTLDQKPLRLEAIPLDDVEHGRCVLVLFHATPAEPRVDPEKAETRVRGLERELRASKHYVQHIIEELESANEALKSNNEELMAANEELEASHEALQAANAELTSLNAELVAQCTEHQQTLEDLRNVLVARDEALVVADVHGNIERFAGAAERMFELGPSDVGEHTTGGATVLVSKIQSKSEDRP